MYSTGMRTRAFYVKYRKILNKIMKEAKKQHCDRLTAKANSGGKIKTT
jgi:hypothetical protein